MPMSSIPHQLKDSSFWKTDSYINGKWVSAANRFGVTDPGTGEILDQVSDCGGEETKRAVDSAHATFAKWSVTTGKERGVILEKLAALLKEAEDDFATIITLENGKSIFESKVEVAMSVGQLEWMAGEAVRCYGDFIPSAIPNVRNVVVKQPIGVVGIITPFNFPLSMGVRKMAAAWAAGCTVVCKAPRETPFSSLAFAVLCERAGLPAGVYNVITTSSSSSFGREITSNPIVRKISFTGSTGVGRLLAAQCAPTLKKCSFELGGNAPFIVFDDADLPKAIEVASATKFRCSGQVCIATNRVLVQAGIFDKFAQGLVEKVKGFHVGHGTAAATTHGPLINKSAVAKMNEHVQDAISQGGELLIGGKHLQGNFYEPTVIKGGSPSMLVHTDETFGPLALLYKFETEEEAIALSNDTDYGLAGYFFAKDLARVWRVAEALNVGMVGVNGASVSQPCAPFGGVNQSGYGREGSKYGIEEYQEIKLIAMAI
ncbi:succinate-semialdehyde dehydrogenase [Meredithblackwellia eburnea MCA 4105]